LPFFAKFLVFRKWRQVDFQQKPLGLDFSKSIPMMVKAAAWLSGRPPNYHLVI
jgi:hypothetical protein